MPHAPFCFFCVQHHASICVSICHHALERRSNSLHWNIDSHCRSFRNMSMTCRHCSLLSQALLAAFYVNTLRSDSPAAICQNTLRFDCPRRMFEVMSAIYYPFPDVVFSNVSKNLRMSLARRMQFANVSSETPVFAHKLRMSRARRSFSQNWRFARNCRK